MSVGIVVLTCKKVNSDEDDPESGNDYSQVSGMDVDKIGMNDDLSRYTECGNVFPPESDIMRICKNNSTCRLLPGPEGYLQVFCDCSNTITETYYFMGPQCETRHICKKLMEERLLEGRITVLKKSPWN
ncbi:hypothetical protein TOT_040000309 [Theileria orientalis strain Shintoku]|uniref:Uncharacterized protein n=1 Tax=Theileria orientalis strain Shintoku TaxID=869250 RepID=J4DQ68_THEOR|nr:hypothetical protein TOT_040000309 [Theileria orientalis strain Shintoku]PVC51362.1 hypothetical protein MACL_00001623 [Theileria orientalis]BAM41929.1 hypothetical protein TOT_040000309 [Theileria orientalis strain Shintoku]|eukprot:XP_009692230.1 hypothetical protein TOT_040000309 [Theileria orientalis strain Shintoku]